MRILFSAVIWTAGLITEIGKWLAQALTVLAIVFAALMGVGIVVGLIWSANANYQCRQWANKGLAPWQSNEIAIKRCVSEMQAQSKFF